MIPRIGSIIVLLVSVAWLASAPDWGAITTFVAAVFTYLAVEVAEYKVHKKNHARHDKEASDLKKRVDALEGSLRATQEVVGVLKKKHEDDRRQADEKLKAVLGKMPNFGA